MIHLDKIGYENSVSFNEVGYINDYHLRFVDSLDISYAIDVRLTSSGILVFACDDRIDSECRWLYVEEIVGFLYWYVVSVKDHGENNHEGIERFVGEVDQNYLECMSRLNGRYVDEISSAVLERSHCWGDLFACPLMVCWSLQVKGGIDRLMDDEFTHRGSCVGAWLETMKLGVCSGSVVEENIEISQIDLEVISVVCSIDVIDECDALHVISDLRSLLSVDERVRMLSKHTSVLSTELLQELSVIYRYGDLLFDGRSVNEELVCRLHYVKAGSKYDQLLEFKKRVVVLKDAIQSLYQLKGLGGEDEYKGLYDRYLCLDSYEELLGFQLLIKKYEQELEQMSFVGLEQNRYSEPLLLPKEDELLHVRQLCYVGELTKALKRSPWLSFVLNSRGIAGDGRMEGVVSRAKEMKIEVFRASLGRERVVFMLSYNGFEWSVFWLGAVEGGEVSEVVEGRINIWLKQFQRSFEASVDGSL